MKVIGAGFGRTGTASIKVALEHLAAFPEAKVLLTVRDPNAWYESVLTTLYHVRASNPVFDDLSKLPPEKAAFLTQFRPTVEMADAVVWQGTFGGRFEDRTYAISVFNDFVADVTRRLPADKLLVFDVKEGWGPLCAFLGVAVPDQPFPHVNDRATLTAMFAQMGLMG